MVVILLGHTKLNFPKTSKLSLRLTVSSKRQHLSSLPVSTSTRTDELVGTMSFLSVSTSGTSGRGESTKLAMLVNGIHDPVVSRVASDGLVLRINKNDLKVRVGSVLYK